MRSIGMFKGSKGHQVMNRQETFPSLNLSSNESPSQEEVSTSPDNLLDQKVFVELDKTIPLMQQALDKLMPPTALGQATASLITMKALHTLASYVSGLPIEYTPSPESETLQEQPSPYRLLSRYLSPDEWKLIEELRLSKLSEDKLPIGLDDHFQQVIDQLHQVTRIWFRTE